MKQSLRTLILLLCGASLSLNASAQIQRSEWSFNPVFTIDNPVYAIGLAFIVNTASSLASSSSSSSMTMDDIARQMAYTPSITYKNTIVQRIETADGKMGIHPRGWGWKNIDWAFRNWSIGYKAGYLSREIKLGFDAEISYRSDGYKLSMPNSEDFLKSMKKEIRPALILKYVIGDYMENDVCPVISLGASYDIALAYDGFDKIHDKNAVNDGFNGIFAVGAYFPAAHCTVQLRYDQSFYSYFNEDYSIGSQYPFKGCKSKFGELGLGLAFGF